MKPSILAVSLLVSVNAAALEPPRKVVLGTYVNQIYGIDVKNSQFRTIKRREAESLPEQGDGRFRAVNPMALG